MEFKELTKKRRSIRKYKDNPVEQEKIDAILEVARLAPTACNLQPQRIKVLTTADDLKKVEECMPFRFGAPLMFVICYDDDECWERSFDKQKSGFVDASIVTTQMMYAAEDLGLSSVWLMYFDPAKLKEVFGLPENIVPAAILPVGYAAEEPAARGRKNIEEMLI